MAAGCLLSLKNKNFLWWCFKKSITALLCFLLCDKLVRSRSSSPFRFLSSPSSSFILSRSTRSTLNTLNAQRSIILFTRGHLHLHHLRHRLHSPSTSTHNLEQTSRLGQFDCLPLNKQNSERSGLATVFLTHFTTQPCPSRTEQNRRLKTKRNETKQEDLTKTKRMEIKGNNVYLLRVHVLVDSVLDRFCLFIVLFVLRIYPQSHAYMMI